MPEAIRLAVLDDNLFVRTAAGEVMPLASTFHRFVEAVARSGHFGRVRYLAPLRQLRATDPAPKRQPVDQALLEFVPTTSFAGIADYLLRSAYISARNWPLLNRALADSNLLWLRLPASNALLALAAARRHRVAHFGWLAGSAAQVARVQDRPPPLRWLARSVGAGYDAVSRLAARSGPLITFDADMFASTVTNAEVEQTRAIAQPMRGVGPWRIVWSGRMAAEKGLPDIVEAVRLLLESDHDVTLVLLGDGPARSELELAAARLLPGRVEWHGHVGDRVTYLGLLRMSDLYIYPSRADIVPKVLVDALAAGLPVVATDVGAVAGLLGHGERGRLVQPGDPAALADAAASLLRDPASRQALRERGLAWAANHTAEAQAERLVVRLRHDFPELPWR